MSLPLQNYCSCKTIPSPFLDRCNKYFAFKVNLFIEFLYRTPLKNARSNDEFLKSGQLKGAFWRLRRQNAPLGPGICFIQVNNDPQNMRYPVENIELKISQANRSMIFNSRLIKSSALPLRERVGERVNPPPPPPQIQSDALYWRRYW